MAATLVLASASVSRARLLRGAGIAFDVQVSPVDEDEIKDRHAALDLGPLALTLAKAKAGAVASHRPADFVIGADQILECDGARFDKPRDRADAANHLRRLRGKEHHLMTAAVVYRGSQCIWETLDQPRLVMRDLPDVFIEDYLDQTGDTVLRSVGAYELEGRGAQLFERVEGDFFSILGLPLLPLLAFLRAEGVVS